MSSRQLHHEPEVVRHAAPPDDVEFMNHAQHDSREADNNPSISTLVAHDVGPENGICGLSSDRVVNTQIFSTIGAHQRGAEVGVNLQKDPALAARTDGNTQIFSTSVNFIILTLVVLSLYSPVHEQRHLRVILTAGCATIEN